MKILPIIASNHPGKNLVNFNADVTILPNTAKGNQQLRTNLSWKMKLKKYKKNYKKDFRRKMITYKYSYNQTDSEVVMTKNYIGIK